MTSQKRSMTSLLPSSLLLLCLWLSLNEIRGFVALQRRSSRPFTIQPRFSTSDPFEKNNDGSWVAGILGDLHMDPRHLEDYEQGREHFRRIFEKYDGEKSCLISLGDLGESKAVWPESDELFSGTTRCHEMAAEYLGSFGVPYEVVGGNHGRFDASRLRLS